MTYPDDITDLKRYKKKLKKIQQKNPTNAIAKVGLSADKRFLRNGIKYLQQKIQQS